MNAPRRPLHGCVPPGLDIAAYCRINRVRFVRKDASRFMRFLGWLLGLFGTTSFMRYAWTTIGRTIYVPTEADLTLGVNADGVGFGDRYRSSLEHEIYHVEQYLRLWHLHSVLYLLFPVPFFLAWYRWWAERWAFLHQIRHYNLSIDLVVSTLWGIYGWPWPRTWMKRWFERRAA